MKNEHRILIVEDEPNIRLGLVTVLKGEGYRVEECARGDEATESVQAFRPDLVLLDVMLPGANGFEVCRDLRKQGYKGGIVMLTAKGQEIDKVVGLDSGADDYVTKPFGLQELIARVRAALRRCDANGGSKQGGEETVIPESSFLMGPCEVDPRRYEIKRDNVSCKLTSREMKLLAFLHANPDEVLTRERLLNGVWGYNYCGTTRTLDQTVAQLRKKLGDSAENPAHLLTVHGVGYRWVA